MPQKPTQWNQIIAGDCVKQLQKLEAGSVDLAFADPPFNIGYRYDQYDDRQKDEDYLNWCESWMAEIHHALKDDGTFWLAIGDEYAAELKVAATRKLGFFCRSWVVWYYTFGVNCKTKFTRSHAHLFYFTKDAKRFTFNDEAIRVPSARQLVYGDKRANPRGRLPDDTWIMRPAELPEGTMVDSDTWVLRPQDLPAGFAANGDTWFFSRVCGTFKERQGFHGCQMPEQLLGRIINSCSNEGERVIDPFAGSGTTLAVAKKLKREYLGFELSKDYAEACRERLADIAPGEALVGPKDPLRSAPPTSNGRRLAANGKRIKSNGKPTASRQRRTRQKKNEQIPQGGADGQHEVDPDNTADSQGQLFAAS